MTLATQGLSGNPAYAKKYGAILNKWPHIHQYSDHEKPEGMSREDWGIKNLKSSINKYSKGSFKFMRFIASSDFPKKLDGFLKFNTDCLRFLITKSYNELEEITPQANKDN